MRIESEARVVGTKIALYGVALMLLGIGLADQLHVESTATNMSLASKEAARILPMIPSIFGALLTFWGATRLSITITPVRLVVSGVILEIAASLFPFAASQLFPAMTSYRWLWPFLLPLFVLRTVGLMFFSLAVLRWLLSVRKKTGRG